MRSTKLPSELLSFQSWRFSFFVFHFFFFLLPAREIRVLDGCDHPNIVRYLGCYKPLDEDDLWIAMEFCGGGSVAEVIRVLNRPLNEDCIALICRETLQGLKYLHSKAIVHRDVKVRPKKQKQKHLGLGLYSDVDLFFAGRKYFVD